MLTAIVNDGNSPYQESPLKLVKIKVLTMRIDTLQINKSQNSLPSPSAFLLHDACYYSLLLLLLSQSMWGKNTLLASDQAEYSELVHSSSLLNNPNITYFSKQIQWHHHACIRLDITCLRRH